MSDKEKNLYIALGVLVAFVSSGEPFGYTRVQRALRWGYNRTCHFVDDAIELGALVRDKDRPHVYRFNPEYSNLYFHADGEPFGVWSYGHVEPKLIHGAFDEALASENFLPASEKDIDQVFAKFEDCQTGDFDFVLHICEQSDPDAFPITWIDGQDFIMKE